MKAQLSGKKGPLNLYVRPGSRRMGADHKRNRKPPSFYTLYPLHRSACMLHLQSGGQGIKVRHSTTLPSLAYDDPCRNRASSSP